MDWLMLWSENEALNLATRIMSLWSFLIHGGGTLVSRLSWRCCMFFISEKGKKRRRWWIYAVLELHICHQLLIFLDKDDPHLPVGALQDLQVDVNPVVMEGSDDMRPQERDIVLLVSEISAEGWRKQLFFCPDQWSTEAPISNLPVSFYFPGISYCWCRQSHPETEKSD